MSTINATSAKLYASAFKEALSGNLNLPSNTIKAMLITAAKAPTQSDTYKDTIGYTSVGEYTLASKTVTVASNTITFDAGDVSQAGVVFTGARYLVLYNDTPVNNKPLIAYFDLGVNTDCDGQLTIAWNSSGIFSVTV